MNNQDAIDQYQSYFSDQINSVFGLEDRLHRKILLVTMLDAWARARYPNLRGNQERFIRLLSECSDWQDHNRVSLPQLFLTLQTQPANTHSQLTKEVRDRLYVWQYGRIYELDMDPWLDEFRSLAKSDNELKLITSARHADLLYTYRNHLVHEFREPGDGMEMTDNTKPYYHGMSDLQGTDTWELVYPNGFFKYIAERSLVNLKKYLQDNDLDPYSFYEFGSPWKRR